MLWEISAWQPKQSGHFSGFLNFGSFIKLTSTFWAATHLFPRAELAIINAMKEEIQGFHMTPNFKRSVDPVQRNLRLHDLATVFFG